MTSLLRSSRQVSTDGGYYITLASLIGKVSAYDSNTGSLTSAVWASSGSPATSTISTLGCLLKDAGKTVVVEGQTFRKIQVVSRQGGTGSTFGVGGDVNTSDKADYLTGYINLGITGGAAAPVAQFGR